MQIAATLVGSNMMDLTTPEGKDTLEELPSFAEKPCNQPIRATEYR